MILWILEVNYSSKPVLMGENPKVVSLPMECVSLGGSYN